MAVRGRLAKVHVVDYLSRIVFVLKRTIKTFEDNNLVNQGTLSASLMRAYSVIMSVKKLRVGYVPEVSIQALMYDQSTETVFGLALLFTYPMARRERLRHRARQLPQYAVVSLRAHAEDQMNLLILLRRHWSDDSSLERRQDRHCHSLTFLSEYSSANAYYSLSH
jgi:hypothetical protein